MFILFCGGITDHVYEAVNQDYVISGFLPRFLVVSGETDMSRIRNTFRPSEVVLKKQAAIKTKVADLYETYAEDTPTKIGTAKVMQTPRIIADLDDAAWNLYGKIEETMRDTASDYTPNRSIALPTFERLSRSILKMGVLLAASRQEPDSKNNLIVKTDDIATAAFYVQRWGEHSIDLILHAGEGQQEKKLERVVETVTNNPGILRGILMRHFKMNKREADDILLTLEERGLIRKEKAGKGTAYWPA
jgi:hypothetical protein